MKFFIPNRIIDLFTIPFHIILLIAAYSISGDLTDVFLLKKEIYINLSSFWSFFIFSLGVLLLAFSVALYTYVNFFEKSFPSCVTTEKNSTLRGIYNYIRHPSYYIFFFITFGTALCLFSFWLFLLACLSHLCLYFAYIIEENRLKKISPEYTEYLKKTKRFLPVLPQKKY